MIFNALGSFITAHFHHERFRDDIVDFTSIFIASNPWILMNQITFKFCWQLFRLQTFCIAFRILHLKYYLFLQSPSANICCASIYEVIIILITSGFRISIFSAGYKCIIKNKSTSSCFLITGVLLNLQYVPVARQQWWYRFRQFQILSGSFKSIDPQDTSWKLMVRWKWSLQMKNALGLMSFKPFPPLQQLHLH